MFWKIFLVITFLLLNHTFSPVVTASLLKLSPKKSSSTASTPSTTRATPENWRVKVDKTTLSKKDFDKVSVNPVNPTGHLPNPVVDLIRLKFDEDPTKYVTVKWAPDSSAAHKLKTYRFSAPPKPEERLTQEELAKFITISWLPNQRISEDIKLYRLNGIELLMDRLRPFIQNVDSFKDIKKAVKPIPTETLLTANPQTRIFVSWIVNLYSDKVATILCKIDHFRTPQKIKETVTPMIDKICEVMARIQPQEYWRMQKTVDRLYKVVISKNDQVAHAVLKLFYMKGFTDDFSNWLKTMPLGKGTSIELKEPIKTVHNYFYKADNTLDFNPKEAKKLIDELISKSVVEITNLEKVKGVKEKEQEKLEKKMEEEKRQEKEKKEEEEKLKTETKAATPEESIDTVIDEPKTPPPLKAPLPPKLPLPSKLPSPSEIDYSSQPGLAAWSKARMQSGKGFRPEPTKAHQTEELKETKDNLSNSEKSKIDTTTTLTKEQQAEEKKDEKEPEKVDTSKSNLEEETKVASAQKQQVEIKQKVPASFVNNILKTFGAKDTQISPLTLAMLIILIVVILGGIGITIWWVILRSRTTVIQSQHSLVGGDKEKLKQKGEEEQMYPSSTPFKEK